jgi:aspartyl-tRNA(Asn)/glutamyl-tRNA(Gln) amidotransferase subunit B
VRRQIELIEDGGTVVQETRLYDPDRQETRSMRSKEDAHDYRYFPDPDLLPLIISQEWIEEVRSSMPPLPATLREQWQTNFGLSAYDAQVLSQDRASANLFSELIDLLGAPQAKLISNLITGELASALNKSNLAAVDMPLEAKQLSHLLRRLIDSTISAKIAKDIFAFMWEEALNGKEASDVDQIIESRGLKQITDSAALGVLIDTVLQANIKSVEEFRAGKEKAFNALVGQVMKASQGKANPQQLNELLRQKLQSS